MSAEKVIAKAVRGSRVDTVGRFVKMPDHGIDTINVDVVSFLLVHFGGHCKCRNKGFQLAKSITYIVLDRQQPTAIIRMLTNTLQKFDTRHGNMTCVFKL